MLKANDTCPVCDKGKLSAQVVTEEFEYKNSKLLVEDYHVFKCEVCKEELVSQKSIKKSEKVLTDFRRTVDGLLISSEIKAIRKKLKMTQIQMASYLDVAKKTFARYENGQVTQGRTMDTLLRIIDHDPHILKKVKSTATQQPSYTMLKESSAEYVTSYASKNDGETIKYHLEKERALAA